jgi:spermidine/putrescine ABC transporter ATP-binding subunit
MDPSTRDFGPAVAPQHAAVGSASPLAGAGNSLTISGLHKNFGSFKAARGVDLKVEANEFVTLLGPSGSGKTTTLMMVAGFLDPDAGEIEVGGQSILSTPAHKRNLGIVFQSYALFPHMTVADNLAFPLQMRKRSKEEARRLVRDMLEIVRLEDKIDSYPTQLSGGQQQRVALARALIFSPSLVLLDEPLGALDAQLRQHLQLEIRQIQRRLGLTVVAVTHDQNEALTMSDRIAVMNDGRVLQIDRPEVVYERPASRFVASFLGESNFLSGAVSDGDAQMMRAEVAGCGPFHFIAEERPAAGDKITVAIRPEKMRLDPVRPEGRNAWPCRVTQRVYSGELVHYHVAVGDQLLSVKRANDGSDFHPKPDDQLYVTWDYHGGTVVREDSTRETVE